MGKKVCNTKQDVPNTDDLTEKDYLTTILTIEKAMVKNYAVAMTEASNQDLCDDYHDMYDNASEMQREAYNIMFKKGWYVLETADESKIGEKLNTIQEGFKNIENS